MLSYQHSGNIFFITTRGLLGFHASHHELNALTSHVTHADMFINKTFIISIKHAAIEYHKTNKERKKVGKKVNIKQ